MSAEYDGGRRAEGGSSTGLSPRTASMLAYLAGPFSGGLILLAESKNEDVRFHAWQSVVGLGGLGIAVAARLRAGVRGAVRLGDRGVGDGRRRQRALDRAADRVGALPLQGVRRRRGGSCRSPPTTPSASRRGGSKGPPGNCPALPALPGAQRRHVGGVVRPVPRVDRQHLIERDGPTRGARASGRSRTVSSRGGSRPSARERRRAAPTNVSIGTAVTSEAGAHSASSYGLIVGSSSVSASLKRRTR